MSHATGVVTTGVAAVPSAIRIALAVPTRAAIDRLEAEMLAMPNQVELETTHHFGDGFYARTVLIPAGTTLVGKVHRGWCFNVLSQGDLTVWIDGAMRRVQAPFEVVSGPGTKRVGYAHTDSVWTCVHETRETDLAKLEAELIEAPLIEAAGKEAPCLG